MSNVHKYGYSQNHHGQGGAQGRQQQNNHDQSMTNSGKKGNALWDNGERLPVGLNPTTEYQLQQTPQGGGGGSPWVSNDQPRETLRTNPTPCDASYTNPGTGGQFSRSAVPHPQQTVPNPQGQQLYLVYTSMAPNNQQFQAGNTTQQVGQPMGFGGIVAADGTMPVAAPYLILPISHGIPGRPPRATYPGIGEAWWMA